MMTLGEQITKYSSKQTWWTIRLLVDRPLREDCFNAYGYFRWLDDEVDERLKTSQSRRGFIKKQRQLIEQCYNGEVVGDLSNEELLIAELIKTDRDRKSKLGSFILNFFAIIEWDVERRGSTPSAKQLDWYSKTLSKAVTDGIEHFINHDGHYPPTSGHYRAALGAHLVHMLRDYQEDLAEGYINISREDLVKYQIQAGDLRTEAFVRWVEKQIVAAKRHIDEGKAYIYALPVLRGKLAACWYCARFERLIGVIERDHYRLRKRYARGGFGDYCRLIRLAVCVILKHWWR